MRIVSWNCGGTLYGGFTVEKFNEMLRFNPDILLIQECTKNEFDLVNDTNVWSFSFDLGLSAGIYRNSEHYWYGDNNEKNDKGLAIFSTKKGVLRYQIELIANFNKNYINVVPYKIINDKIIDDIDLLLGIKRELIILSIWTQLLSDGSQNNNKTIFDALDYYNFDVPIILAGDFNTGSNSENVHLYEELKTKIEKYGLKNCAENTEFEYEPTFYHDKTNKYFTNDFCFIPKSLNVYEYRVDKMNNQKNWKDLSNHCPIISEFGETSYYKLSSKLEAVRKSV